MPEPRLKRLIAIAQALLVTTIWASSFIFIKIALDDLDPLTLGGLRYFLGGAVLMPFAWRNGSFNRLDSWSGRVWWLLICLGVMAYTIGNGLTNWGLKFLPATTGSFLISLVPLVALIPGILWLKEIPTRWQGLGVVVSLTGSVLFFSPGMGAGEAQGLGMILLAVICFAGFSLLGRLAIQARELDTLTRTAIPLMIGGGLMLLIGVALGGFPQPPLKVWGIVAWLTLVNTAFAYWLYNVALNLLTALEMNMILNLSPLETALFAGIFLGEPLIAMQIAGILVMILGVGLVQFGKPEIWRALRYPRGATRF
jgi:drug/metabolite transporter (DMT)-like permease